MRIGRGWFDAVSDVVLGLELRVFGLEYAEDEANELTAEDCEGDTGDCEVEEDNCDAGHTHECSRRLCASPLAYARSSWSLSPPPSTPGRLIAFGIGDRSRSSSTSRKKLAFRPQAVLMLRTPPIAANRCVHRRADEKSRRRQRIRIHRQRWRHIILLARLITRVCHVLSDGREDEDSGCELVWSTRCMHFAVS